jgi:hypothetical protein
MLHPTVIHPRIYTTEKRKRSDTDTSEAPAPKKQRIEQSLSNPHGIKVPELAEWDPNSLPDDFFMVLEGKRRTGKSTFAKWLLQFYQDKFNLVICMTNTKASGFWQKFVGSQFTHSGYVPEVIIKLLERNDKIIERYGRESEATKKLGSTLIIMDDVISQNIHDDPTLLRLAVEGRHHLFSVILMTQDPKAISPKIRDNTDCAVIFNQKTFRNKDSVWGDFMNDTPKDFALALLSQYAVEHDAIVTIQTNLNADVQKSFFKTTGDKTKLMNPDYMLGCKDQKDIIQKERDETKIRDRQKEAASKYAHQEPGEIQKLTVEKILK